MEIFKKSKRCKYFIRPPSVKCHFVNSFWYSIFLSNNEKARHFYVIFHFIQAQFTQKAICKKVNGMHSTSVLPNAKRFIKYICFLCVSVFLFWGGGGWYPPASTVGNPLLYTRVSVELVESKIISKYTLRKSCIYWG